MVFTEGCFYNSPELDKNNSVSFTLCFPFLIYFKFREVFSLEMSQVGVVQRDVCVPSLEKQDIMKAGEESSVELTWPPAQIRQKPGLLHVPFS